MNAMNKPRKSPCFPRALIGSAIGATLGSVAAASIAASVYAGPVETASEAVYTAQSRTYEAASSRPRFRLSPVPPGADWNA
jgi:hypothetical protein